ncbi:MAG: PKD domain-containing protein [Methanoregula sp.]|nr:PKD domain-containing protein [Methanoregula sp.]
MQKILRLLSILFLFVWISVPAGVSAAVVEPGSGFIVVASAPVVDFYASTQTGSAPLRVSFFDRSEGTPQLRYLWDFGDGSSSFEQNPTHTYTTNGKYTVSLTVTNSLGQDTRSLPGYIAVGDPPVPQFSVYPSQGNTPLTVTFTDLTTGGASSWNWDFGDGISATVRNPAHVYPKPGIYSVTLFVTNEFGSAQITKSSLINAGVVPDAEYIAETRQGDPPLTVRFRDFSSGYPLVWVWDFGDGATSTEKDPVHSYAKEGSYTTRLYVANAFGNDSITRPNHITVGEPVPTAVPQQPENETPPAAEESSGGINDLIREAKGTTEKNLPTSGFIPPEFMALAAVLTSFGILLINILVSNIGVLSQIGPKILKFIVDLAGGHAVEELSAREIEKRGIGVRKQEQHFFGFSPSEVLVLEVAIIMVALAFILADRAELTLETVLIYIIVGAISVVLHDFAHRYFATRHGHDADTRFWGLGTGIMFLTAWLYGNAFAQSYRNLVERQGEDEPREMAIEMMAGPCVSIILMVLFLALIPLGGLFAIAGGVGFSINLITAVYSLMPIETMDGRAIWKWNRVLYLALFLPMIAFYFYTYMIV